MIRKEYKPKGILKVESKSQNDLKIIKTLSFYKQVNLIYILSKAENTIILQKKTYCYIFGQFFAKISNFSQKINRRQIMNIKS